MISGTLHARADPLELVEGVAEAERPYVQDRTDPLALEHLLQLS